MKQRRVCLIGAASSVHVQRWALGLQGQGIAVSLISTTPSGQAFPRKLRSLPIYTIPTARSGMGAADRLLTLLRGWGRVPALVRALSPDVVHMHALPTPAAVPLLRLVQHLVVSVWGSDVVQRDRRKTQLYPGLLAHAAEVTATSHYLATVAESYLRAPRVIHVVPFGVDVSRFHPAPSLGDPGLIGTLRHLEPTYGIDVLVAALPLLAERVPQLKVAIGGGGTLTEQLQRQARDLGVSHHIEWRGRVPYEHVPAFLRSLGLFVMPSRAEAFGVAALEAQACGVPVIASHVGGLPEVVRDGQTGILVPPDDSRQLADAVLSLVSDPARRSVLGKAAAGWVRERYDWQASIAEMLSVYDRVW